MSGVEEAPREGVMADSVCGGAQRHLQGGVHVATLGGEGIEKQGVHTYVNLDGMKDQATTKEGQDREVITIPDGNNPLMELQPCGPPEVCNAVSCNVVSCNAVSSNAECKGTTRPKVDHARKTIANAKEILRNSDQCVTSESKLEADELNDIAEILQNKDGEMAPVGYPPTGETNDANMTALFENSNSSLPFIIKGMSDTLDHILSVDKTKSKNKNELIQVVQNAHMLLRSNYNLVLKCDSNLAIIVKKIKRLYRLYRKLGRPARMSRKEQTLLGGTNSNHGDSTIKGINPTEQDAPHQGDGNRKDDEPIEGVPTQNNGNTCCSVQRGGKEEQRNVPPGVASRVGCGYSSNVGEADLQVDPPCGELKPDGGKENEKETLLNGKPLEEVVPPANVGLDQGLPYMHPDVTTVKDCPQGDTQKDSNCVGKEECPMSPKKLSYAFVKGEEERNYKNLTSIDSKSTAMSNHKEDAWSSIGTDERKKKKKTQRERKGGKTENAENVEEMHHAQSSTKERNKNKKKEREKKRILRELSKLNSLFFLTFNHKGDIINYLHREIRSSISEFDAAYQLYLSR
ncbi:Uncharacterized protein PCOAH_00015050 [Plasmodium coatneyi]|uniref:Uncharacterized protein n=1 Tax=Plasmodium coatneyi TaxID=208452 RepID=A0A1B1DWE8_9APIC|nr:Uncharacterized protein PCOAH_00015050 [Plasmodium coatneyi]ANQ07131.1 Uncharacterized protein PCOAH_00015050 [Plasmodium coatneyi]